MLTMSEIGKIRPRQFGQASRAVTESFVSSDETAQRLFCGDFDPDHHLDNPNREPSVAVEEVLNFLLAVGGQQCQ